MAAVLRGILERQIILQRLNLFFKTLEAETVQVNHSLSTAIMAAYEAPQARSSHTAVQDAKATDKSTAAYKAQALL